MGDGGGTAKAEVRREGEKREKNGTVTGTHTL